MQLNFTSEGNLKINHFQECHNHILHNKLYKSLPTQRRNVSEKKKAEYQEILRLKQWHARPAILPKWDTYADLLTRPERHSSVRYTHGERLTHTRARRVHTTQVKVAPPRAKSRAAQIPNKKLLQLKIIEETGNVFPMKDVHRLKADMDNKEKNNHINGNKDLQDLWEEMSQIPGDITL